MAKIIEIDELQQPFELNQWHSMTDFQKTTILLSSPRNLDLDKFLELFTSFESPLSNQTNILYSTKKH
jgi:hypothetical protein